MLLVVSNQVRVKKKKKQKQNSLTENCNYCALKDNILISFNEVTQVLVSKF